MIKHIEKKYRSKSFNISTYSPDKKEPNVYVIYIEDSNDWQDDIRDMVYEIASSMGISIIFISYNGRLESIFSSINSSNVPAILISDLKLVENLTIEEKSSEFQTVSWITEHTKQLIAKNWELFIISGHIPQGSQHMLTGQGFGSNRIFNKISWHRSQSYFKTEVIDALEKLTNLLGRSQNLNNLIEIRARLFGENLQADGVLVNANKFYDLEISITNKGNQTHVNQSVVLKKLVFSHGIQIDSDETSIFIPLPGIMETTKSRIKFLPIDDYSYRKLHILIYLKTSLLRHLEFDVFITT